MGKGVHRCTEGMRVEIKAAVSSSSTSRLAPAKKKSSENLVGRIINLVTSDLDNISGGLDFLNLCACFIRPHCRKTDLSEYSPSNPPPNIYLHLISI